MTERPIVHFTPGGKEVTHGGAGTAYSAYGCRCEPCTRANADRVRRRQQERRPEEMPATSKHGTYSAYVNWNCRCQRCKGAHRDAMAAQAENRRARS